MKTVSLRVFGLTLCVAAMAATSAMAAQPRFLEVYGDWDTYAFTENGNKICYMASRPTKSQGNYTRRGEIFAYITHRPGENTRDVFGYVTGYTYKSGSDVKLKIGSTSETLFTKDDKAWALDEQADAKIVDMIKKGSTMVVDGVSSRGTKTTDTFSLKGSTKAYERITSECGLK